MNIAPNPNASSTFAGTFAGAAPALGSTALTATGFETGLDAGFAADTAATFLGAVAFFGVLDAAAFLVTATGLLAVFTVRTLSVSVEDTGLGAFDIVFATGGTASAFTFATGDLAGAPADLSDEAAFGLIGDAFFAAGEDFGASILEACAFSNGAFATGAVTKTGFSAGKSAGAGPGDSSLAATAGTVTTASADSAGVASLSGDETGPSIDAVGAGTSSPCLAAASISDDVITTRLIGAPCSDEATDTCGLDADFDRTGAEAAETGFALEGTDVFFPDFAEVFCRETAIASNLVLAGANAPISCCIAT